jgi:FkbM family methyltransferase
VGIGLADRTGRPAPRPRAAGYKSDTYDVRVPQPAFVSYAQNGEDVVLWRALRSVTDGKYVEVGANHPTVDSVTRAFYDRGWSGITVEPVSYFADLHRASRPRDQLFEAAVSSSSESSIQLHMVPGTGLSTLVDAVSANHERAGIGHVDVTVPVVRLDALLTDTGWDAASIHFLLIDVEGAERSVLETIDLARWRPWVIVVESTAPNSTVQTQGEWEDLLLGSDYEFCLFDGVSRFYVAREHAAVLRAHLSYPACPLDEYVTDDDVRVQHERDALIAQAIHWRTIALTGWAHAARSSAPDTTRPADASEIARLNAEIDALRQTLSWRATRGLRVARRAIIRARHGR